MREAKIHNSLETLKNIGVSFDAVVDVGIQHSTPVLIDIFPDIHHYLFEPIKEYYPFIKQNYKNLRFDLIEVAVSDHDGDLVIHSEKKTRGDEISHSYIVDKPTATSRTVKTISLDSFQHARNLQGNFLLKIDVEGPDVPSRIISGASKMLKSCSVVIIEMTVDTFMQRAILLHNAGFDIWDICDLCYYGECLWQGDVVFIKRELKQAKLSLRPMHKRPFQSNLWQSGF